MPLETSFLAAPTRLTLPVRSARQVRPNTASLFPMSLLPQQPSKKELSTTKVEGEGGGRGVHGPQSMWLYVYATFRAAIYYTSSSRPPSAVATSRTASLVFFPIRLLELTRLLLLLLFVASSPGPVPPPPPPPPPAVSAMSRMRRLFIEDGHVVVKNFGSAGLLRLHKEAIGWVI